MDFSTLVIGNIVTITLNTSKRLIGEFIGYNDETKRIVLKNVRFQYDETQAFGKSSLKSGIIFEEFSIERQHILKLEVFKEEKQGSNLVQVIKKSDGNMSTLNWMMSKKPIGLLYQADIQKDQFMQDFCKNIFDNTNFAQLLRQPGKNIEIGLPKYFVRLHREPIMPIISKVELNNEKQYEQPNSLQETTGGENVDEIDDIIEENDNCDKIVSELQDEQKENDILAYSFVTVHQVNFDEEENLQGPMENENPSNFRLSPFLKHSNGELYLNEEYFKLLCQPVERVATEDREPLLLEDVTNLMINCQAMGE